MDQSERLWVSNEASCAKYSLIEKGSDINLCGSSRGKLTQTFFSYIILHNTRDTHGGGPTPRNVKFGAFMGSGRADYSGK